MGYSHKNLMSPNGNKKKIFLELVDLNNALTLADTDIKENWERYKERYLRRIKS